jgi:DNA-binding winged helix-turn-helix (wHTH) protein
LNTAAKKIRAALNDEADSPRYLETVPRRGYRFIAPVQAEMTPSRTSEDPLVTDQEVPETHRPLINSLLKNPVLLGLGSEFQVIAAL